MVILMLKEYRLSRKFTQEKLADLSGIEPRTILRIEKDLTMPLLDTYARLVVALNLSDEEIGQHVRKIAILSKKGGSYA